MSYSISTLLPRNLHGRLRVLRSQGRRLSRPRDEIDRIAGAIKATHPDFRYQPIAGSGQWWRVQWVSGRPGEAPAYAGIDFIIARNGRMAAVYLFLDKLQFAEHRDAAAFQVTPGRSEMN
jgi:hypothetical protein